jgi:hypothetical protein
MGNQATALCFEGKDAAKALEIIEEAKSIAISNGLTRLAVKLEPNLEKIRQRALVSESLQKANNLRKAGDKDEALKILLDAHEKVSPLNREDYICPILHNLSLLFMEKNNWETALQYLKELEEKAVSEYSVHSLFTSLANQAFILLRHKKQVKESLPLAQRAYNIAQELNDTSLSSQITPLLREIYDKHIYPGDGKFNSPEQLANDFLAAGDIMSAMVMHITLTDMCRQIGDTDTLQRSLSQHSLLLHVSGNFSEALSKIIEISELIKTTKNIQGFILTLKEHLQIAEMQQDNERIKILKNIYRQIQ